MRAQPAPSDQDTVVRLSVDVVAPPERAYEIFTAGIDSWWTREHHVLSGELKVIGVDPFVGGRMWQENDAGDTCEWGRVITWDPPREFGFTWLVGPDWGVPAPDAPGSRVRVTFTATDTGTRVDLVHDQLEFHGPGWEIVRDGVASPAGWPAGLSQYAAAMASSAG
jgi:uncharacterized protein YndB with AHSA1/START domain